MGTSFAGEGNAVMTFCGTGKRYASIVVDSRKKHAGLGAACLDKQTMTFQNASGGLPFVRLLNLPMVSDPDVAEL